MMAPVVNSMPEGYNEKDLIFGKLFKCINHVGQMVMCHIAKEAYSDPIIGSHNGSKHLKDYCAEKNITLDRRYFSRIMECNIIDETFDISAASIILKIVCVDFYNDLRCKCQKNIQHLVKMRNDICHKYGCTEEVMYDNLKTLQKLIKDIYKDIAKKTGRNYETYEKNAINMINEIANTSLQNYNSNDINNFKVNMRFHFISDGREHLQKVYAMLTVLNPCTWLGEIDYTILHKEFDTSKRSRIDKFKVNKIFTPLKTKDKRSRIEVNNLLKVTKKIRGTETLPQVLVLEGQAGCGKTSLCRFLVQEWCKTNINTGLSTPVINLPDFDLVILVELRRTQSDTFIEFIREELMAPVCITFETEDVKCLLHELHLLIIIDGYDERKDSKLVKDIFDNYKSRIVISTRTKCLEDVELLARKHMITFLTVSICGFDSSGLEHFAEKVFLAIEDDPEKCKQEIESFKIMINEKKHVVKTINRLDEYELPLTIAFIIIIWRDNPNIINELSTSTRLYMEIINLFKKKLIERLQMHSSFKISKKHLESLILLLGEMAWKMLKAGDYFLLTEEIKEHIRKQCQQKNINYLDLLSAFLMCETNLNSDDTNLDFMFLHKTQMEYLAASYLAYLIQVKKTTIKEISHEAEDCEEVLVYLTGCMAIQGKLNKENSNDIIRSFGEKREDFPFWWELYSESLEYEHIGKIIVERKLPQKKWDLDDNKVLCGLRFLNTTLTGKLKEVVINVKRDPNDIPGFLKDFKAVKLNSNELLKTELYLTKQNDPETKGTSDEFLAALTKWGTLTHFVGSLGQEGCAILSNFKSLVSIRCKVSTPKDVECLSKSLLKLKKPLRQLRVTLDLQPGCKLPSSVDLHPCDNLELWFYDITNEHKEWLVNEVIKKVTGEDGCRRIGLMNSALQFKALKWIVINICGICMEKLVVETPFDISDEQKKLQDMASFRIEFI